MQEKDREHRALSGATERQLLAPVQDSELPKDAEFHVANVTPKPRKTKWEIPPQGRSIDPPTFTWRRLPVYRLAVLYRWVRPSTRPNTRWSPHVKIRSLIVATLTMGLCLLWLLVAGRRGAVGWF